MKKIFISILVISFLGFAHNALADVGFDSSAVSSDISGQTSGSLNITTSGANRYLVCGLSGWDNVDNLSGVAMTYNGVSMSKIGGSQALASNQAVLWGLVNPASGSHTVSITNIPSGFAELAGGCVSFTGVDQSSPLGTIVSSETNSANITLSSGDMGVDIIYSGSGPSASPGANETQRVGVGFSNNNKGAFMGTEVGSGSITMDWTGTNDNAIAAVPIKAVGNGGGAPADSTPPSVSGGSPTGSLSTGTTQTTLSVTTDESATCRYGTTAGVTYASIGNTFSVTGGTSHSVTVSGLSNGSSFNYFVRCQDSSGNANASDYGVSFSVASGGAPDTTAPSISSISSSSITSTGANITWTTNELADTQVEYGLTSPSYGNNTTINTSMVTSHNQSLTGLSANTLYHYRVKSKDAAGNLSTSGDNTFTTGSVAPSTFTLTISKLGSGTGTISGGSISCGSTCTQTSITSGTSITLTASASGGSTFVGWSGGGCSGTGSCSVTVTANTSVSATFNTSGGGSTITAASCSQTDVQNAINSVTAGGTVNIPAGTCTWGAGQSQLSVNKAITLSGAGQDVTIIDISSTAGSWGTGVVSISAAATVKSFTIRTPTSGNSGTAFNAGVDGFRITDIKYQDRTTSTGGYFLYTSAYGLVDSSNLSATAADMELIFTRGPENSWQTDHSMGGSGNVFIEDNTFSGGAYLTDCNSNARCVVRYNTINGNQKIDGHGKHSNTPPRGVRHMEVYGNTWTQSGSWTAMELRGGGGRIFNNTAVGSGPYLMLNEYDVTGGSDTSANYPIGDQIGVGKDPKVGASEPMYLWGNRRAGSNWIPILGYGEDAKLAGVINSDRDYFNEATSFNGSSGVGVGSTAQMNAISPTKNKAGFWVTDQGNWNTNTAGADGVFYVWNGSSWIQNYTPYQYPHPMRTGSVVTPPPTTYILSVTKNGTGSGTVTSSVGGVNCGSTCSSTALNSGTSVTLTATAAGGSTFAGWSGGSCSGTGTCSTTVSSNTTVTATFNTSVVSDTTLPTVSITSPSNNASVADSISISATASDNIGVIGVQFKLDGTNLGSELTTAPYSGTWNTTGVSNGSHTLTATARDAAGNVKTSSTITITVSNVVLDTTAPTIPTGLTATVISSSQINLSWTASTDAVGVLGYKVYRNGVQVASPGTNSYSNTGLTASTLYSYTVSANDAAGNNSSQSASVSATTQAPPDVTAPTISSVTSNSLTSNSANITWTTNESSDTQVEYGPTTSYGSATTLNTTLTTSHSASITGLNASTLYHYRVKSRDAAGNLATGSDLTFTTSSVVVVDTTAPVLSSIVSSGITDATTTITWTTNEASNSKVDYGTTVSYGSSITDTTLTTNHSVTIKDLSRKTGYNFKVSSTDSSGNVSASTNRTFTTASRFIKPPKVTGISAAAGSIILSWVNPNYEYLSTVAIMKSSATYPSTLNIPTALASLAGTVTTYSDSAVVYGTTYYYSIFTVDDVGTVSDPVFIAYTPIAPVTAGSGASGGGGGGSSGGSSSGSSSGSSTTVTTPTTGTLTPTVTQKPITVPVVTPVGYGTTNASVSLTKSLSYGMTDPEVTTLQTILISKGLLTGTATGYYGSLTQAAVIKFQASLGIPTTGTVGPLTRLALGSTSTTVTTQTTTTSSLTRSLYKGITGTDVTTLQKILQSKGYLSKTITPTTLFGPATETAVKAFQCAKMSICSGSVATNGYGFVGAKTRAALVQ